MSGRGYPKAPTLAILLELEQPVRIVTLASTEADMTRLIDWLAQGDLRELIAMACRVSFSMQPDSHLELDDLDIGDLDEAVDDLDPRDLDEDVGE